MDAKKPLLSVIIPTLNEEKNLPKLLKNLAEQTFRDFEVIIGDSPSTVDKTREIAAKADCRIVDGGRVSEGRNNGASIALGKVFLFLDADVRLPNIFFLEDTVNEFVGRDLDLAACRVRALDGDKYDKLLHGLYNVYSVAVGKILPHVPGFCFFIKRSIFEAVGGFDIGVKLAEDHDLARRSAKIGTFGFLFSQCIPVSTRRFERDGRFVTAIKYILCELHMLALGPVKSDIFKYRWGHGAYREELARKKSE